MPNVPPPSFVPAADAPHDSLPAGPEPRPRVSTPDAFPPGRADRHLAASTAAGHEVPSPTGAALALHEKQGELQQILEAIPVGISLVDETGQQTWFNPALDRIWAGARPVGPDRYGAFVGLQPGTDTRLADDRWPIRRALRGETVSSEAIDIVAFDGTRKCTVVSAVPLRNETGVVTGAVAVQEDVTERLALEAHHRLLGSMLEGLSDGACVITRAGDVIYANRACCALLDIDRTRVPGISVRELRLDAGSVARLPAMLEAVLTEGRAQGRVTRRRHDGAVVPLDVVLTRADGIGAEFVFAIVRDATEHVAREQHLRRAERLASVGTLVAGVAHELNNPLQAILSFAQLLRLQARDVMDAEALAVMQREAERMAKIVADLKQVAGGTQQTMAQKAPVDVNEVVRHVCRVQDYRLRTSNVAVTLDLAEPPPHVLADRAALEQVVLNLVVNACDAMATARGGQLLLRTSVANGRLALVVADDGPGIAADHLPRVFDPFFTTKPTGQGTGLGLSVVHGIVTDHGGAVRVDSEPGLGTTLHVELPLADQTAHGHREAGDQPAVGRRPPSLRVLVVDDEPAIRLVLTTFLEQRGHVVHAASEGGAALRLLEGHTYDVILSDLRMPGLDGPALLRHIRERQVPGRVVFMTGDPSGAGEALAAAGIELLYKPMKLDELARAVEGSAS